MTAPVPRCTCARALDRVGSTTVPVRYVDCAIAWVPSQKCKRARCSSASQGMTQDQNRDQKVLLRRQRGYHQWTQSTHGKSRCATAAYLARGSKAL